MAQQIKKADEQRISSPIDPFSTMRAQMDRIFDQFTSGNWNNMPSLLSRSDEGFNIPSIDVRESGSSIVIEAEVPGMKDEDVDVELHDRILTIKGEKKIEEEKKEDDYHLTERRYGSFRRSFRVPDGVDEDKIDAKLENGVLHITLPKKEDARKKTRKISVAPK